MDASLCFLVYEHGCSDKGKPGIFQHGSQHLTHLVRSLVTSVNAAGVTSCHSKDGGFHRSEESLLQRLMEERKGFGEAFGLETEVVHRIFQLLGRLVFPALFQMFRNIVEQRLMVLPFQLDDSHIYQQLDSLRIAYTVFLPVSSAKLDDCLLYTSDAADD